MLEVDYEKRKNSEEILKELKVSITWVAQIQKFPEKIINIFEDDISLKVLSRRSWVKIFFIWSHSRWWNVLIFFERSHEDFVKKKNQENKRRSSWDLFKVIDLLVF